MTAGQLSNLLVKAAELVDVATGKAAEGNQVRALAARLEPFAGQSLADFGDFLAIAAGHARGDLHQYYHKPKLPPRPRQPRAPRPAKSSPAERVADAVARLKDLYDRGLEPGVTPEVVDAALEPVGKFTLPQLAEVLRGCGFEARPKKKPDALSALRSWLLSRRGSLDRAHA